MQKIKLTHEEFEQKVKEVASQLGTLGGG